MAARADGLRELPAMAIRAFDAAEIGTARHAHGGDEEGHGVARFSGEGRDGARKGYGHSQRDDSYVHGVLPAWRKHNLHPPLEGARVESRLRLFHGAGEHRGDVDGLAPGAVGDLVAA
jgi:hypothetical protein